jgi:hypothetical protein
MMTSSMGLLRAMDGSACAMGAARHDLGLLEPAETHALFRRHYLSLIA